MLQSGMMIIISGPSGAGKSTVIHKAMAKDPGICFSVSATSRAMRPGETDGVDYFFVTKDIFLKMVQNQELLEHAEYVGNYYGTPISYVQEQMGQGMKVVLDIEVQGARQVAAKMPDAIKIFLVPPSLDELRNRLIKRATDSPDVVEARIARARQEYQEADFYDYIIVNSDADEAANELLSIICAVKCQFDNRKYLLAEH